MSHSCPDGKHSKLTRTGPIGTREGVTFSCSRCGYTTTADQIMADFERIRPIILARLSGRP